MNDMSSSNHNRANGFTLIEVLVAFSILIGSLGFLYEIFITSRQRADVAVQASTALAIAQSKLAEQSQTQQSNQGHYGPYHWRTMVSPYPLHANELERKALTRNSIKLVQLTVTVEWVSAIGDQQIELTTLRTSASKKP